jgi:hypothetical protein
MEYDMGLPTVLFLIFMVLKLTHTITWSWWWVFAPVLIDAGIGFVLITFRVEILAWMRRRVTQKWRP